MIEGLIGLCIAILVVGIICGLLVFLIDSSPIAEPFKGYARWLVIVIAVLVILVRALPLLGISV